jgi:hypothetical protein
MGVKLKADGMGGELTYESSNRVDSAESLRMTQDHILVEPLAIEHSKILAVVEDIKPVRGVVKAVGPGIYPLCYDHPEKSKRTRMWRSSVFQPTQLRVGDIVELGCIQHEGRYVGYSFQQITVGGELHIIASERDVSGVIVNE